MRIAEFSELWEGRTIDGAFPLHRFLGAGETSVVYLTTHGARNAAIKLVPVDSVPSAEAQLSMWREAAKLSHPNLIGILATGRSELDDLPLLYVVMERAEEDLSQVLPDRSLTAGETREMLEPTLSALDYIHRQGFMHAHLKPSNITAVEDCLKISSDGIRRAGENKSTPTPYDPPERTVSAAGDIWSLGITLVEVLTQWLPSNGTVPPELPDPFAGIARGCLVRNPADRSTIPQILTLLGQRAPAVAPRKRRLPVGVLILLAGIVIVVAGVFIMHSDTGTPAPVKPAAKVKASEPQAAAPTPVPKQTATATKPSEPEPTPAPEPVVSAAPVSGILEQPLPEITDQARSTIHGKVKLTVRVEVAPSGAVTDAKLDPPNGSKYFGERALAAVRQWRFEPVSVNGSEVGQRWRVRFEFVKSGTKVQPQRISP